jgi:hypothetical protein
MYAAYDQSNSTSVFHVLKSENKINLPVLCNVKRPLELQVSLLVVVYEGADCGIVATSKHSGRGVFFGDCPVLGNWASRGRGMILHLLV